ncbi:sigma 54-interacting transcriptional regulator [Pelosinus propionicus]|uniref:HTH-type transcriptional regulatory protein TyrR n=1 Tax=Pelosinus propionicus DSM 13327 TaxID=1123291 RepID=A0A1I4MXC6_9FIRM|nr:sigma 54-interacting transcriptional regulator [Pelosinus propionicus]SFM07974.1 transcriptional regulator of aroF, aroG, tyrA and aromatic amino acid transport [Pelosinus propionicus DSM 13327]
MTAIRWMLKTGDRIGMIQEVAQVFSQEGVSIKSMEVSAGQIFIKFHLDGAHLNSKIAEALKKELLNHNDIHDITNIALQPYEQREKELQAVLEFANDGIIGLDSEGTIRYINSTAAQLLRIDKWSSVGKNITQIIGTNTHFSGLLSGKSFDHQQMLIDTSRGTLHYLCSGRPIQDENNQNIGSVATLKSMNSAKQLVNSIMKNQKFKFDDIIYVSSSMGQLITTAQRLAINNCSILIRGESGTGKEMFAQAIHHASSRCLKSFVPINCAALPETLLESELFGYEDGSFSGARKGGKSGLFEIAHGGTIFFDEISELPLVLQGKLLRVLQEGVIRRVGSTQEIPIDVRILAATNRNLEEMIVSKQFRQDLYYRINVIPLQIPPLRQRPEDIPILLRHFHVKHCSELNRQLEFSPAAIEYLMHYEWPGNVRELQNIVLRSIHLTLGKEIDISDLLIQNDSQVIEIQTNVNNKNLKQVINHTERMILEKALKKCGSARGAARAIGLSHTTVLTRIRRYGLEHLLGSHSPDTSK